MVRRTAVRALKDLPREASLPELNASAGIACGRTTRTSAVTP